MAANTNINTLSVDCHRRSHSRAAKRTLELRENLGEFAEVEHPGARLMRSRLDGVDCQRTSDSAGGPLPFFWEQ